MKLSWQIAAPLPVRQQPVFLDVALAFMPAKVFLFPLDQGNDMIVTPSAVLFLNDQLTRSHPLRPR